MVTVPRAGRRPAIGLASRSTCCSVQADGGVSSKRPVSVPMDEQEQPAPPLRTSARLQASACAVQYQPELARTER
jgi:hypothetical protein